MTATELTATTSASLNDLEARLQGLLTIALDVPEPSTDLSGWLFEPADPEVGVRVGYWVHEDCPSPFTSGDAAECFPVPDGQMLICPDCAESVLSVDYTV